MRKGVIKDRSPKNQKKRGRSPLTPRTQQKMNEASKLIEMQNAFGTLGITSKKHVDCRRLKVVKLVVENHHLNVLMSS